MVGDVWKTLSASWRWFSIPTKYDRLMPNSPWNERPHQRWMVGNLSPALQVKGNSMPNQPNYKAMSLPRMSSVLDKLLHSTNAHPTLVTTRYFSVLPSPSFPLLLQPTRCSSPSSCVHSVLSGAYGPRRTWTEVRCRHGTKANHLNNNNNDNLKWFSWFCDLR